MKVGDIVKAEGMLGIYEITGFKHTNALDGSSCQLALLKPLQYKALRKNPLVNSETRYAKDIKKLTLTLA